MQRYDEFWDKHKKMIVTVDNKEDSLHDERSESGGFNANFRFTETFKFLGTHYNLFQTGPVVLCLRSICSWVSELVWISSGLLWVILPWHFILKVSHAVVENCEVNAFHWISGLTVLELEKDTPLIHGVALWLT